ncbi:MAG: glycoside hydrolase family 127 protein [Anaerolineae bacterium]|nr:glycoside hydrolase family 127 protein [Anaerolineae bacterium]
MMQKCFTSAIGLRSRNRLGNRIWSDGDRITFDLPFDFRLVPYTGLDQDKDHDRYALKYGPILLALVGETDLDIASGALASRLTSVAGNPLHFGITGYPGCQYMPYWQVQAEGFTCFPTMR